MLRKLLPFAVGIAAILLPTAVTPAQAAPTPAPQTDLIVLTVNNGEQPTSAAKRRLLTCDPAGGTHPQPQWACHELASANGSLAAVKVGPERPCYLIYAPVTVTAWGFWNGRPVTYRETFPNDCVLGVEKGPLFQF